MQSLAADFVHDLALAFPYLWGFFLAYVIGQPLLEADNRRYCLWLYGGIRPRHVAANIGVAAVTILVYFSLSRLVPALNISWVSIAVSGSVSGGSGGTNAFVAPISLPLFGPIFALLLLLNFPLLTRAEERIFRAGTSGYLAAVPRSLVFGLVHCLVGVPLAAGFALAIPGLWFSHHYLAGERRSPAGIRYERRAGGLYPFLCRLPLLRRMRGLRWRAVSEDGDGIQRATLNHTCYNALLICGFGILVIVVTLG